MSLPKQLGNENSEQTMNNHSNHHFLRALTNPEKIKEQQKALKVISLPSKSLASHHLMVKHEGMDSINLKNTMCPSPQVLTAKRRTMADKM